MKKILLTISMMILVTLSLPANDQQFYFIAKPTSEGIYLRWDVVEGNFPDTSDIDYIVLKKNDQNISKFSPDTLMSEVEIKSLYARPSNEANLMKMISSISQNTSTTCHGANLSNYASVIRSCMQDSMWRYMAAKIDYNIALIERRAYHDTEVATNPTTYELVAVKKNGTDTYTKRLGKVVVDPTKYTSVLGAKNFKQVRQSIACTAPEYAKDDYTVSLSWENGGLATDAFANSMMVTGYDLYRATTNNQPALTTELSALAKNATTNSNGEYLFTGLEKVNDVPILLANNTDDEKPLYLETQDVLKKSGLKPGDSRWYYLVAKDFTGHYGPMAKYEVTIPDLLPPVTPWGVRVIEHEQKAKLIWDNVNVVNYAKHFKNSRKFCNLNTLALNQRLRFADKESSCGAKDMAVNLNVKKYYIYRFDNPSDAAKFKDSDMDGISDLDEKEGEECVANALNDYTKEKARHLVAVLNASDFAGEEFITYVDTLAKSKYYWYRISSATESIPSSLTPPIRAMIPDRELPKKIKPKLSVCASDYIVSAYSLDGEMPFIAYDETKQAKEVKLTCVVNAMYAVFTKETYLPVGADGYVEANGINLCDCSGGMITFLDEHRNTLATKPLCSGCSTATEFYVLEDYDCTFGGYEWVHDGEDLHSWPLLELEEEIGEDECIEFTVQLGYKRVKISRNCNEKKHFDLKDLNLSNLGSGEKYCIGMTVLNENNQHSPTSYLPCFAVVDETAPNKPSVRRMNINDNNISVAWLSPQEKIASTIVKLYNSENSQEVFLRTYAHPDHMDAVDKSGITMSVDIAVALNDTSRGQKWCAKAKSIGFNGRTSAWSKERCTQIESVIDTSALPWPKISSVNKEGDFNFEYNTKGYLTLPLQEKEIEVLGDWGVNRSELDHKLEEAFKDEKLNFVLYRQERVDNVWSKFVQVSPLVSTNNIKIIKTVESKQIESGTQSLKELENNLYMGTVLLYRKGYGYSGKAVLFYMDRYPFRENRAYRYVKVNLDKEYEIINYETSGIVVTGREESSEAPVDPDSGDEVPIISPTIMPINNLNLMQLNQPLQQMQLDQLQISPLQITGGTQ